MMSNNKTPAIKISKFPVIFLHGLGQSGKIFQAKTGAIRSGLKKVCSFHYLDGPFQHTQKSEDDDEASRSWVERDSKPGGEGTLEDLEEELEKTCYHHGMEESYQLIAKKIVEIKQESSSSSGSEEQHQKKVKVGLVGFSFGAAVIAEFLSKLKDGDVNFLAQEERIQLDDIAFVGFFSGFLLRHGQNFGVHDDDDDDDDDQKDMTSKRAYFSKILPSYHCFGLGDAVVLPTRSLELASLCRNRDFKIAKGVETDGTDRLVEVLNPNDDMFVFAHQGGHFVPSQAKSSFTKFVKQFV